MAEKSMEKPDIVIQEWPVSFYISKKRQWVYGLLSVKSLVMLFKSNNDQKTKVNVAVKFSDFTEVKKAKTGLVFGAIVVETSKNENFWFSSLEDREGVYASLRHFWKAQLVEGNAEKQRRSRGGETKMGQALLGLVNDSQATLSQAGAQLHEQGRQIDYALGTMHDLHNDLDIADHVVEDLQAWVGRWQIPQVYTAVDPVFVNLSDVPEVFEFEVLYTQLDTGKAYTQCLGLLRISKEGVTVLTAKQAKVHHFRWSDVSQIRVVTPWEMMVVKFQIGKPDLKFSIVCANMVAILKLLQKCAKYKLHYDTPPDTVLCHRHGNRIGFEGDLSDSRNPSRSAVTTGKDRNISDSNSQPMSTGNQSQLLIDQSGQAVSEREAEELSQALTGLKSLALAVQEEELSQNEKLDRLRTSVDRANDRLKMTERKMKQIK